MSFAAAVPTSVFGLLSDCLNSAYLLLMSGDDEANTGPTLSHTDATDANKTPSLTSEGALADAQQNEILNIQKELQSQSATISESHKELKETIAEIGSSQLKVE